MKERRERERKVGRKEGRKKKDKETKAPKRQMKLKELETKQYRASESCGVGSLVSAFPLLPGSWLKSAYKGYEKPEERHWTHHPLLYWMPNGKHCFGPWQLWAGLDLPLPWSLDSQETLLCSVFFFSVDFFFFFCRKFLWYNETSRSM